MSRLTYIICAILLILLGTIINYMMITDGDNSSGSRGYSGSGSGSSSSYGGYGGFSGGHK
ncbi:hypothetical protein [Kingella denitrificans]|uniref:Uncharacterized protein n=1 Tax=Kingella denitrificans ATCC 33394 TaxID=888741 RepID=F0EYP6_9NEIS|nr:hypothetical protein [Kingella denitrificans]EGC17654.1 hypothetical protein HMPREF9098_0980 [Kingella denitrificans ATCC 33394]STR12526.1 Uncharacterised protein [Kingella denitrificans]